MDVSTTLDVTKEDFSASFFLLPNVDEVLFFALSPPGGVVTSSWSVSTFAMSTGKYPAGIAQTPTSQWTSTSGKGVSTAYSASQAVFFTHPLYRTRVINTV